jgi:hypothetical protein
MGTVMSGLNPKIVYKASEGQKFAADQTLIVVNCATCGVTYAIPESFNRSALAYRGDTENGWKICCPFGHTWWYVGETEKKKLKRQLEAERDRRAATEARLDQTKASLRAQKGATTRAKKQASKAAHGVCPVPGCKRHFANVERHVHSKHPDWAAEHPEAVQPRPSA